MMVVVVDLDEDNPFAHPRSLSKPQHHLFDVTSSKSADICDQEVDDRPNPNINGFSAALSCYPIVRQLASQLDLNTLHSLSRTCRQFRANLLEYRDQIIRHTLRCASEELNVGQRLASRLVEAHGNFLSSRQLTSGRVGRCARDMVGNCQRCESVVCRNCIIKPPITPTLRARHRRLCRTCTKIPLHFLTTNVPPSRESGPMPCVPTGHAEDLANGLPDANPRAFTTLAFERTPCVCDVHVWLCQPCDQQLKAADTTYVRAWSWRTRYSHYLGGVGTGVGEGNEGVECGRGANCFAARIVEHEVDCDATTEASLSRLSQSSERWKGTSYHTQEIEGIGGVVKMKLKRQVHVGECVKIYEDERNRSIQYLEREVSRKLRSWCSWCERVVPSDGDRLDMASHRPPSSGSSSSSSIIGDLVKPRY